MSDILKPGDVFENRYVLLEKLGAGGIGTVFKAKQTDFDRIVALKIIHDHIALDQEYTERFIREAQSLSKLSHANIVGIYHLGQTDNGIPYLSMEYLEGQSVKKTLNSLERIPVKRALKIIRDAALALDFIHKQGIVHRDLKCENIMLVNQPEPDTVKLVDFGLVHLSSNKEQRLTQTGQLIGTAAYMSPEQAAGKAVDFRSDIYSLTVCLFEMITGHLPFSADSAVGIMYKHVNEPVPEIKAQTVLNLPSELNAIIARGMSKDPSARFASMSVFAENLDKLLDDRTFSKRSNFSLPLVSILILALAAVMLLSLKSLKTHDLQSKPANSFVKDKKQAFLNMATRTQIQMIEFEMRTRTGKAAELADLALSSKQHLKTQDLAQLLYLRACCTQAPGERIGYYCKIIELAKFRNNNITRELLLSARTGLSECYKFISLPRLALEQLNLVFAEVNSRGMSESLPKAYMFDAQSLYYCKITAAQIYWQFGDLSKSAQMLHELKKQDYLMSGDAPWTELCLGFARLGEFDTAEDLVSKCNSPSHLSRISAIFRSFNKKELAHACIKKAKHLLSSSYFPANNLGEICEAEAYLLLEEGKTKQALKLLKDFCRDSLKNISNEFADYYHSKMALALCFCGDVDEARQIFEPLPDVSGEAPSKINMRNFVEQVVSRNLERRDAARLLASPAIDPHARCVINLALSERYGSETEAERVIYGARALQLANRESTISRNLKLYCSLSNGRNAQLQNLPEHSLAIFNAILEDIKISGIPEPAADDIFIFTRWHLLSTKTYMASSMMDLGEKAKALSLLSQVENAAIKPGRMPWRELLDLEGELRRTKQMELILSVCPDPESLLAGCKKSLEIGDSKLAERFLAKARLLSKNDSDSLSRLALMEVSIDLESGKKTKAIEVLRNCARTAKDLSKGQKELLKQTMLVAGLVAEAEKL